MQKNKIINLFNKEVFTDGHGKITEFVFFTDSNPLLKDKNSNHEEFNKVIAKLDDCKSKINLYSKNIRDVLVEIIEDVKDIWKYDDSCLASELESFVRDTLPDEYTVWTDKITSISNYLNIYNEETITEGNFNCDNYKFYNNKIRLNDQLIDRVKEFGNNINELLKLKQEFDDSTLERAHLIQQMYIGESRKRKSSNKSVKAKKAKAVAPAATANSIPLTATSVTANSIPLTATTQASNANNNTSCDMFGGATQGSAVDIFGSAIPRGSAVDMFGSSATQGSNVDIFGSAL